MQKRRFSWPANSNVANFLICNFWHHPKRKFPMSHRRRQFSALFQIFTVSLFHVTATTWQIKIMKLRLQFQRVSAPQLLFLHNHAILWPSVSVRWILHFLKKFQGWAYHPHLWRISRFFKSQLSMLNHQAIQLHNLIPKISCHRTFACILLLPRSDVYDDYQPELCVSPQGSLNRTGSNLEHQRLRCAHNKIESSPSKSNSSSGPQSRNLSFFHAPTSSIQVIHNNLWVKLILSDDEGISSTQTTVRSNNTSKSTRAITSAPFACSPRLPWRHLAGNHVRVTMLKMQRSKLTDLC